MSFKIESLKLKNFKCFDDKKFYEFRFNYNANPIILSGPNGFGKTTFFDAIELIFTNNITRLDVNIEDQRINLGRNILLNTAEQQGFLVLTLIDKKYNKITIIAKISNITKLTIESSLKFTCIEGDLDTNEFESFLKSVDIWHDNLDSLECVRYIKEHFNVYYYVSQAEAVHFLKNTINVRKNSMNGLLQLEAVEQNKNKITEKLIGRAENRSGVVINDEIAKIKRELKDKLRLLKIKIDSTKENQEKVEYSKLLTYSNNEQVKSWDLKELDLKNKTQKNIENIFFEIDALVSLNKNFEDYRIYISNRNIESLSKNNKAIECYIKHHNNIINEQIDVDTIESEINKNKKQIEIYKYSDFFMKKYDIESYQKQHLIKLKELFNGKLTFDVTEIDKLITSINTLNTKIDVNQKMIDRTIKIRENLHGLNISNGKNTNCPYCGFEYHDANLLEKAYDALTQKLTTSQSKNLALINQNKNKIIKMLESDNQLITNCLINMDSEKVKKIQLEINSAEFFLSSEQLKNAVLSLSQYLSDIKTWIDLSDDYQIAEIRTILNSKIQKYNSESFTSDLEKYNLEQIFRDNENLFKNNQESLLNDSLVLLKKKYINYKFSCIQNKDISNLKDQTFTLLQKQMQMELARTRYTELKKLYEHSVDEYKNKILDKLRVPLLIYTGKILQDYQNGLGVFINKDEMRFVSNGDAKHDILNTFSSGQLSGFILSFLFAMNKRYIFNEMDDIGFILIDDPVQTMDDINIASFIEVLRNDFKDTQIVLSTHETDKENYILYKFLKYNLKGQSFNVKDNMYQ